MHSRLRDGGLARDERRGASRFPSVHHETRSERVREIRRRVADDAYRSAEVAEKIARRILRSREL